MLRPPAAQAQTTPPSSPSWSPVPAGESRRALSAAAAKPVCSFPVDVVPWPDDAAACYRARGYWAGLTLGDAFDRSVASHAGRIAVVDGTRRVTYAQLGRLVDRLALHLAARGI